MKSKWILPAAVCVAALEFGGLTPTQAQQNQQLTVDHSECIYFGPGSERFQPKINNHMESPAGRMTRQVTALRSGSENSVRAKAFTAAASGSCNLIDGYIFADLQTNNIQPAGMTTDYEFIRRVTLDLTGRIPAAAAVNQFVESLDPMKRAALVDRLLATPAWTDKWTMFYGDLYKNTQSNTQVNIRAEGRNAFYKYLRDSLAANKPYNQMASEIIAVQGTNSFDQTNGQINYFPLGIVGGGPTQDIFDNQTANIADQFLGLAHVNCLLCHNGLGHLTTLSLWGGQTTRNQAWGLSAFMAHTWTHSIATPKDPNSNATYNYYSLDKYTTDYALNTTTGNRPPRQPIGTLKTVTPAYLFGGKTPNQGEDYRAALARNVTGDFQFARAAVNYVWAAFFGVGIVDPPDQFDPARLDPNNPPPAPWTLQPTNAKLLNALAQSFIDSGYNIQKLQKLIATSDTYQLASEYTPGNWQASYEQYFARKFVRRLWSEEVHDSVTTAINTFPSYTVSGFTADSTVYGVTSPGFGKISYAMQAPDVVNVPDGGGAVSQFMDTFLRGNRDDQPRKTEGSILQALGLMNDNFIQSRIHATGTQATSSFLMTLLPLSDDQLVSTLFIDVLSRYPTQDEKTLALAQLEKGGSTNRKTNAEDLLWTLFNKVDFVFNY